MDYKAIDDPRGYLDEFPYPIQWRLALREKSYSLRGRRSDLTQRPLVWGFEMHEGIFPRHFVGKQDWQHLLMAGPNVFLLRSDEHRPQAPSRTVCFWLAVARYGLDAVQNWVASLPFKSHPGYPWIGSYGCEVISRIQDVYPTDKSWTVWFEKAKRNLDCEA